MPKQHRHGGLGARERQIMDTIYQLGEASVAEVLAKLADPPTYSSVRTMIRALEAKGHLRHREVGTKYVYRPAHSREAAKRSALKHLIQTFFAGSAASVVEAILDPSVAKLTDDDIRRLEQLIHQARQKEKQHDRRHASLTLSSLSSPTRLPRGRFSSLSRALPRGCRADRRPPSGTGFGRWLFWG